MINSILKKMIGTRNDRVIKKLRKQVEHINSLEKEIKNLSDEQLKGKTAEFKSRLEKGESIEQILPEAFAVVREASVRTLGMRPFDVQLIGGLVLHYGNISEMRTGEGKTLVATLPAYLNALTGKGVHIITVNDYLAARDAAWMTPIYEFLGLTVGVNVSEMDHEAKQEAYRCDITYGTNNEFGFDYLRDNMLFSLEHRVQRPLHYAIVDEVDSILVDEARTPLIISGPADDSSELYKKINEMIPMLTEQKGEGDGVGDYTLDEKQRQAMLTESGHQKIEELFIKAGLISAKEDLYDVGNISLMHHLNAALRAHALYRKDVDYIVKEGQVVIVDEHTGRLMSGRRWGDGLHQAVEAKEGVKVQSENQTLASITFQNYFRLYEKLAGMTGTADTEAYEFQQIYGLEVIVIPTNKPVVRQDLPDQVYLSVNGKFNAIVEEIKARQQKGQPILAGTASIENSERLAHLLKKEGLTFQVLNAKFHEKEAQIIAQAGKPGAITIATNMAGRGTDIVLGGNLEAELEALGEEATEEKKNKVRERWQKNHDEVVKAGGLHVLGTERHESRRIDNQLRGRSGRQGDPGSTQFYLSLEDNLMRIFASDRVSSLMRRLGMKEEEAIEHSLVTRAIENAQRKVEGHNFDIRKQLLEYDDIANDQRKVIYQQRYEIMTTEHISDSIASMRDAAFTQVIDRYVPPQSFEDSWDIAGLKKQIEKDFMLSIDIEDWLKEDENLHEETLRERILETAKDLYEMKTSTLPKEIVSQVEHSIVLQSLDKSWREHLSRMDYLRQGIHLRGYAQKNPVQEYKREAFELFTQLLEDIKYEVTSTLLSVEIKPTEETEEEYEARERAMLKNAQFQHETLTTMGQEETDQEALSQTFVRGEPKLGRNEPCHCGSGKKYKQCHGKLN